MWSKITLLVLTAYSVSARLGPDHFEHLVVPNQIDVGEPLYLTPLIQQAQVAGNMTAVQDLARVTEPLPDLGTLIKEHYAGFLTVNETTNSNMFFWFFPVDTDNSFYKDPLDAPTVIWLQGGPGASSMFGLFEIHGPISAVFDEKDLNITRGKANPHSWNREANMIYIDNPVGAGFSFSDPEGLPKFQDDIARDLHEMLVQFFELFPEYVSTPFYPFGESYAGKYVPTIAKKIWDENNFGNPRVRINIQGLGVGDGFLSPVDTAVHADQLFGVSLIDEQGYNRLKTIEQQIKDAAAVNDWTTAHDLWGTEQNAYTNLLGCGYVYDFYLCGGVQPEENNYGDYVNYPQTRKAIHVGNVPFGFESSAVYNTMYEDFMMPGQATVEFLLESTSLRFFIFDGARDIICNHPGVLKMFEKIQQSQGWSLVDQFFATNNTVFISGTDDTAGYIKVVGNLEMFVMRNAGHMVARSQPVFGLDMFGTYLRNEWVIAK